MKTAKDLIQEYIEREAGKLVKSAASHLDDVSVGWESGILFIRALGYPGDVERVCQFKIHWHGSTFVAGEVEKRDAMAGDIIHTKEDHFGCFDWDWPITYLREWYER